MSGGNETPEVVCCGHACLDVIPRMLSPDLPAPGGLAEVGPADVSTGGSVSNTGLALHALGVRTRLVARVGDDPFGREVRRRYDAAGVDHALATVAGGTTSYTVVLSPPGGDRRFLHCPGLNAGFTDADVPDAALAGARLMHFGYPPVMRAMCADGGAPLARLFGRARAMGLLTSLDLCGVDPASWAGRVDWPGLLGRVLPLVDVFLPGADELADTLGDADPLSLGCAAVVVKDGERGLRVRTSPAAGRLGAGWGGRDFRATTYVVPVAGTTGAGDATIAGFLAGLVRGETIDTSADLASAAGARCVTAADATSGLCGLDDLRAFIASGPPRREPT